MRTDLRLSLVVAILSSFTGAVAVAQVFDPGQIQRQMAADRSEADRMAGSYNMSRARAMAMIQARRAAEEQAATAENERDDRRFMQEHPAPPTPAKLTPKEREKLEKARAEYQAIRAASDAMKAAHYDEALKKIDEIPGADRDIGLLKFKARQHVRLGQFELAVEDYNKLLGLANDLPNVQTHSTAIAQVLILRSRAWQSAGKYDRAEADLNEALKRGGPYLDASLMHVESAELYFNAGKWQQAVDELTVVMQRFSGPDRYAKRGMAYLSLGEKAKAAADLDQAIAGKSKYRPAWLAHAVLAAAAGQSQTALDDCDYAIQTLAPKDPWPHAVKGNIYLTVLKQPSKAIEEFDAALRLDPQSKDIAALREEAAQKK
jgi:tetratricopeptide (TPR) repeat protein